MATIITNENFKELLTGSLPVVIDFNASWCGP
ncbi:MAG: thioredoxin domain-containing protein, partial [Bacteroidales bacterium]|nr:thioredoxin domain-containing protein [Bacteroidales bacterium]